MGELSIIDAIGQQREGATLRRHWKWNFVRQISSSVNGKFAEIAVDKSDLNNSNDYNFVFYGANTYGGGVIDDSVQVIR